MSKRNHFNSRDIEIITDFVRTIDEDIEIFKGSSFCVDIEQEEIFLGNKRYDRVSKMFMNWLNTKINTRIDNWLAISILHEVGHIMTDTDDSRQQRQELDSIYSYLYETGIIESEEEYFTKYFEIPAEYEATMWGVSYYLDHKKQCDDMVKMIGSGIY